MTKYIHHTGGRLRTRHPQLKNDPPRAEATEAAIRRINGVLSVKASPFTGNLFIRFHVTGAELDVLLESIHQTKEKFGLTDASQRPASQGLSRTAAPPSGAPNK